MGLKRKYIVSSVSSAAFACPSCRLEIIVRSVVRVLAPWSAKAKHDAG